jgi:predicted MFS family arabinose efflux permease
MTNEQLIERNVLILGVAQSLGLSAALLVVLVGGIVGEALAPSPALATLPITTLVVGTALGTVPAALWMRRVGRRWGFVSGTAIAAGGALLAVQGIRAGSLVMFCAGTLLIGINAAFMQQYRFAAAESVTPERAGRAVSFVLIGGIVAGFLGPEIGRHTRGWLTDEYAGSFLAAAVVFASLVLILAMLRVPMRSTDTAASRAKFRALEMLRRPGFALALIAATAAYGVMSFLMTATPVSMHSVDGMPLDHAAAVIQSHVIAMYAPSLFTGFLVDHVGARRLMAAGAVALIACVTIAATSHALRGYWSALVLLGLGWNFLFVGATVLLTRSYRPEERFGAQAFNDFVVLTVQAAASFGAGFALHTIGWSVMNIALAPILIAVLIMIALLGVRSPGDVLPSVASEEPSPTTLSAAN